ncbi:LCP family protein [Jatrophihabitans lederbergiae]|uniref:LCP family protein n=1 Tax=Jatrophihabitans lederbergiae TaxID=3075547 RepID=A0ABU2JDY3_9ACTN|nr:LCP family protein [Jatrophihabitans sp. DSM 44399]MDT0263208.1 LCP family protein [Jatrophihabitans sp. DSM 44399]
MNSDFDGFRPSELSPAENGRRGLLRPKRSARTGDSERAAGSVRRGALLGVQIVAAVLSLTVLVGSGIAWATYRNFTADIRRVEISTHSTAAAKNIDGSAENILIVGNDDRDTATDAELAQLGTTRDGGSYNTDTMMLLHVPADGSKATVISFPRDSYVTIPGHGKNKLNSAYVDGVADSHGNKAAGASLLTDTLENLTGLNIDHFVQVDLLGFYRISNAIGGVTVCLNSAMRPATYTGQIGNGFDSGYEADGSFVRSYSGIDLKKGDNVIRGTQALAFVRQRHGLPAGDLDRIKRQQYFLSAVFRKLTSGGTLLNPFKLQHLLNAVTSSLTMDQSLDPAKLAQQMQNLSAGNVTFTTIPLAGEDPNSPVGDVVLVNTAAVPGFISSLIGGQPAKAPQSPTTADPKTVTVTVVNDSDSLGRESANAAALRKLGFKTTVPPATTDVVQKTTIEYPPGADTAARAVAKVVPGAALSQSDGVSAVTLVLGNDGVQVPSAGSSGGSSDSSSATGQSSAPASASHPVTTNAAQAGCIN